MPYLDLKSESGMSGDKESWLQRNAKRIALVVVLAAVGVALYQGWIQSVWKSLSTLF